MNKKSYLTPGVKWLQTSEKMYDFELASPARAPKPPGQVAGKSNGW